MSYDDLRVWVGYDEANNLLEIQRFNTTVITWFDAPHDPRITFWENRDGIVVDVCVRNPRSFTRRDWEEHPDRQLVPDAIYEAVDRWLATHL